MSHRVRCLCLFLALALLTRALQGQPPFAPQWPAAASDARKIDQIVIPHLHFKGATLEQAVDLLRAKSREFDRSPSPAGRKGFKIILRQGDTPNKSSISQEFKDERLSEILRYVTELSGTQYRVEENTILIVPISEEFDKIDPNLHTRTFKVPPDFHSNPALAAADTSTGSDPFAPSSPAPAPLADPFAPPAPEASPSPAPAKSAPASPAKPLPTRTQQVLEDMGIPFPEGASASLNPLTNLLTVTNTSRNLDLIEAWVEYERQQAPATVAFTLTIIEGPGDRIRQANATATKTADASQELATLLELARQPGSTVRVIGEAFLETQSGARASVEVVRSHKLPALSTPDVKSAPQPPQAEPQIGLRLELEPTVSNDKRSLTVSPSLWFAAIPTSPSPPTAGESPAVNHSPPPPAATTLASFSSTSVSLKAGGTKLIAITKSVRAPQENADILCAAFLTATLRHVIPLPEPAPTASAPSSIPSGMIFTSFPVPEGLLDESPDPATPENTLQTSLAQMGLTTIPGSSFDHREGIVRLVNTPDNVALIKTQITHWLNCTPKTVSCTLHTLEAPAPFLRDLAQRSLATADDAAMLAAIEAAVARGEARFISSSFLNGKSGNRTSFQSAREHSCLDEIKIDARGNSIPHFTTRLVGSIIEIELYIGADSRTVDLSLSHELHTDAPLTHRHELRLPSSTQPLDVPVIDFSIQKTSTSLRLTKGSTKLISLNAPAGLNKTGTLWATFLKCDLNHAFKARKKLAQVQPPKAPSSPQPEKMIVRRFGAEERCPELLNHPGFQTSYFLPKPPPRSNNGLVVHGYRPPTSETLRASFVSAGVEFPPGAYAQLLDDSVSFIVRNTPENIAKIQAAFQRPAVPTTAAFTFHVIQAPGPLLRRITAQAATTSDHSAVLAELLAAVKSGSAQALDIARIETQSGSRATYRVGAEHPSPPNDKSTPKGTPAPRTTGLNLELEPTIGADGVTVDLTLDPEFHTAPPFEHREHIIDTQGHRLEFPLTDYFTAKVTTGITIPAGSARLLSLHKPTGKPEFEKEDILQAIFITCDLLRAEK